MLTMNTVHVITPAYCTEANQRLPMLLQTIQSVKQQTWSDYVHIIVDDGSADGPANVMDQIAENDPLLLVLHKTNGGSSAAINYGVEQGQSYSKAKYITVCHSDDLLLPDSLEIRTALAEETGSSMVYSDAVLFNDEGRPPGMHCARYLTSADELYTSLLRQGAGVPYLTMLWDADFFVNEIGGFDERLTSSEDWDIALRTAKTLSETDRKFAIANTFTAAKRSHDGCLRIQNVVDGTKMRCYELILGKHLTGESLNIAMERVHKTRLAGPRLSRRIKFWIRSPQRPKLVRGSIQISRGILNSLRMRGLRSMLGLREVKPEGNGIDTEIVMFLDEMERFTPETLLPCGFKFNAA